MDKLHPTCLSCRKGQLCRMCLFFEAGALSASGNVKIRSKGQRQNCKIMPAMIGVTVGTVFGMYLAFHKSLICIVER